MLWLYKHTGTSPVVNLHKKEKAKKIPKALLSEFFWTCNTSSTGKQHQNSSFGCRYQYLLKVCTQAYIMCLE